MDTERIASPEINVWELYELVAALQGAPKGVEDCFRWTGSAHPAWGRAVYATRLAAPAAASECARKARELDCLILTGPAAGGVEASERALKAAGCAFIREAAGMVLDAPSFKAAPLPSGYAVEEPRDHDAVLEWARLVCRELFEKPGPDDAEGFAATGAALARSGRAELFLCRGLEGGPLAASASFMGSDGTGGIYFVATDSRARRRGLGSALASVATERCLSRGARRVILQASAIGEPVYRSLGYERVSSLRRWKAPKSG